MQTEDLITAYCFQNYPDGGKKMWPMIKARASFLALSPPLFIEVTVMGTLVQSITRQF